MRAHAFQAQGIEIMQFYSPETVKNNGITANSRAEQRLTGAVLETKLQQAHLPRHDFAEFGR